jgi:UDP-galactopyranose mutase
MIEPDVVVVGGGISGASLAYHAARAGKRVHVVEREERAGGCMASEVSAAGTWYELGAHTCYNSYGAFLEVLEGCGLLEGLQARGKPVLRFLRGDELVGGKNLFLLLRLFGKLELLRSVPGWFGASQEGETVRSYYSRFVGPRNYDRVLGAMLSAVPSQEAHDFPADMLFKRRERRRDVMRSFTLPGGLRTAVEAALARPGIEVSTGRSATALARADGGFALTLSDGERLRAPVVALAVPPGAAAQLLSDVAPEAADVAGRIQEAEVDSLGFVVPLAKVAHVPYSTFLIPLEDAFHSIVTRDVVPDDAWRAFTFHFRPGLSLDERVGRAARVLGLLPADVEAPARRRAVLPSPRLGHAALVTELDRALGGLPLALTGNWFGGLSIEDCVLRSRSEWARVSATT